MQIQISERDFFLGLLQGYELTLFPPFRNIDRMSPAFPLLFQILPYPLPPSFSYSSPTPSSDSSSSPGAFWTTRAGGQARGRLAKRSGCVWVALGLGAYIRRINYATGVPKATGVPCHTQSKHLLVYVHNKQMGQTSDRVELFCLRDQGKHLANTWRNYKTQRNYRKQQTMKLIYNSFVVYMCVFNYCCIMFIYVMYLYLVLVLYLFFIVLIIY